ncbi:4-azaleucine resistance transporter AzlC [Psychromicrobium silvestre]|uniref:4-azaleucine resistance transporter AzlC n=1 Tax=Psychromicrobium silvestre TaxID=1645614 RepID=A0A7Y9LTA7_9MICC|nr:AzlC family ABC transporter permease [Psychromicrobium silvestre]NYE95188.1 4-azaleucine resistance transporter AzlC [Psychromicrobium silvestre]
MRSIWRTSLSGPLDRALVRNIALVCLADALVGVSFGAIAVSTGLPLWVPVMLSLVVFAGASQFIFIGLVASGGNPFAAMLAGLLVNMRHVPLGFAVADAFGERLRDRLFGSYLMADETVAFTMTQQGTEKRRAAYWLCGIGLFLCWNLGTLLGAYGGGFIKDTNVLGLDAAFPAVLLALLLPSLTDAAIRRAAAIGAAIALVTSPFLPAGMPVILALVGVLAAWPFKSPEAPLEHRSQP